MRVARPLMTPKKCPKCRTPWPDYRSCDECKDKPKRCATCGKCAKCGEQKRTKPNGPYHVHFRDHRGESQRLPAFRDRGESQKLGHKLGKLVAMLAAGSSPRDDGDMARWIEGLLPEQQAKLDEWGMLTHGARALTDPLTSHAEDYYKHLTARGKTRLHSTLQRTRVLSAFTACGFVYWRDIAPGPIERWLAAECKAGRMKQRTSKHYVTSLKAFCSWMVRDGRAAFSPLDSFSGLEAVTDETKFGAFTPEQVQKLLDYTDRAEDVWGNQHREPIKDGDTIPARHLTGHQRSLVYRFAVETALRANVLRTLRADQVRFERDKTGQVIGALVRTTVGQQKNRKAHDVPLRRSFAVALADHMAGKIGAALVFDLPKYAAAMLRNDLHNAGVPLVDADGLPLMFHSFRATCATWLGEAGFTSQQIAAVTGHQSRAMVDHYTHTTLAMARRAVEKLPELRTLKATGTGGEKDAAACRLACSNDVATGRIVSYDDGCTRDDDSETAVLTRWGGRAVEGAGLENR